MTTLRQCPSFCFGQARSAEVPNDVAEELWRGRHIKEIVLAGAVLLVDGGQRFAQLGVGGLVAKVAALIVEALLEAVPGLGAVVLGLQKASGLLAELLKAEIVDGHAEDGEFLGQQSGLLQVVEGGDQLAHREIAGGPEHHHGARARGFARLFEFVV